jgi:hypothetical protein
MHEASIDIDAETETPPEELVGGVVDAAGESGNC